MMFEYLLVAMAQFTSQAFMMGKGHPVAAGLLSTSDWADGAQSLLGENTAEGQERDPGAQVGTFRAQHSLAHCTLR